MDANQDFIPFRRGFFDLGQMQYIRRTVPFVNDCFHGSGLPLMLVGALGVRKEKRWPCSTGDAEIALHLLCARCDHNMARALPGFGITVRLGSLF